jgi:hypothetical protein
LLASVTYMYMSKGGVHVWPDPAGVVQTRTRS